MGWRRFSNPAVATWLRAGLQRLHREASTRALAAARLAEQDYRFERSDETAPLLGGSYFGVGRAGLLAGEHLLVDLESLEWRFIETSRRIPEMDQAFSLAQLDDAALVRPRGAPVNAERSV